MTYVQLGRITIPAFWLAVLLSLVLLALAYRMVKKKGVEEWYWNSFFLYLLVWKLSYILFNLSLFLDMPLSILYFNGGIRGHVLGIAAVTVYVFFIARKKYATIQLEFAPLFLFFFTSYEMLLNVFQRQYIEGIIHFLIFLMCLYYLHTLRRKQGSLSAQAFLMILLSELFVITFFGSIFSIEILTFLWLAALALLFIRKNSRNRGQV